MRVALAVPVTAAAGYLAGSVPVAVLVGRRRGVDVRAVGDRNPGYWNAKAALGRRAAVPVFVGDVAKGVLGAGVGRALAGRAGAGPPLMGASRALAGPALADATRAAATGAAAGPWWLGHLGGLAAMTGHAWPVFAGFRGGRSVLTFAGAATVVSPRAAAVAVAACVGVTGASGRFAWGARVGVFGFPIAQALVDPIERVAATGVLMSFIGVRFALAARAAGRVPAPGPARTSDPARSAPVAAPPG